MKIVANLALLATMVGSLAAYAAPAAAAPAALAPAAPAAEPLPSWVVSLPVMALSGKAGAVQVERGVQPHASITAALAVRDSADGDYQGIAVSLGSELRLWWRASQRGVYVAPRLEAGAIHLSSHGRSLGTSLSFSASALVGYRFVIADHLEITPNLGLGLHRDLAHGRVPGETRHTAFYGITLGWVFST